MKNQTVFNASVVAIALFLNLSTTAQTQPFPANKTYSHGLMAAGRSD
jgi:hypothetical protein